MTTVPRSEEFDDVYFSQINGLEETQHVFLKGNNLPSRWSNSCNYGSFLIAETGFGTGLNFLSAWALWNTLSSTNGYTKLHFVSVEKYPLDVSEIFQALRPWEHSLLGTLDLFCNQYRLSGPGLNRFVFSPQIELDLFIGDANDMLPLWDYTVHAWFLDGFKPATNPQMWSETIFSNMARLSKTNSTFATFTAAGSVRRGLSKMGFEVHKIPGYGTKRDMLTGTFIGDVI